MCWISIGDTFSFFELPVFQRWISPSGNEALLDSSPIVGCNSISFSKHGINLQQWTGTNCGWDGIQRDGRWRCGSDSWRKNTKSCIQHTGKFWIWSSLKNYKLSDDIAFRFSNPAWEEHPLTVTKYASWLHSTCRWSRNYQSLHGLWNFRRASVGRLRNFWISSALTWSHNEPSDFQFEHLRKFWQHILLRDSYDAPYYTSWRILKEIYPHGWKIKNATTCNATVFMDLKRKSN